MMSDISFSFGCSDPACTDTGCSSIGLIRTDGTKSITITPNTSITVNGYVDKEIPYQNTLAIVQSTTLAKDSDYDIEPSLIQYHHKQNGPVTAMFIFQSVYDVG
jgi:hypothetical protein